MKTRYSKQTGCFYPFDQNYAELPADTVEVNTDDYFAAMNRTANQDFAVEANGALTVFDRPAPPLTDVLTQAIAEVRVERAPIIAKIDGIAGRLYRAGNMVDAQAADTAINALLDITTLPALLKAKSYAEMKAAVLSRYREIAAAAPASVRTAFVV